MCELFFAYTRFQIFRSTKNQFGKKKRLKDEKTGEETEVVVRGNHQKIWLDFFHGNQTMLNNLDVFTDVAMTTDVFRLLSVLSL